MINPRRALARLVLVFLDGRNYDTENPYARSEIRDALRVLGVEDIEDVQKIANDKRRSR